MQYEGSLDTICAVATPAGEGGIGIVRISGRRALPIIEQMFHSPSGQARRQWQSHRLYLGFISDGEERVDEVLAVYMPAPHSYTGEDVVEIHGHGGSAPLRRIVDIALRHGARVATPGEFTMRAFLNGRMDLAQAEAVIDIIRARTDLSLRQAMGQYSGKLSNRVGSLRESLLDWTAQLEANIDFPEDDVPSQANSQILERADSISRRIAELLAGAEAGRVLRDGVSIAIVGKPNVGKSSLLNALLGESRAIVTEIAGTTRDTIEEWLNVQGVPMRVIDTAGIRHSDDAIESIGIERSRRCLQQCDLALVVLDGSRPPDAEDDEILASASGRPMVVVVNKADLYQSAPKLSQLVGAEVAVVEVSALRGGGLDRLVSLLASMVWKGVASGDEMVGGNLRHRDALYRAQMHVRQARDTAAAGLPPDFITIDLRAAILALGEITGASVTDEIIMRIFSQFCIGK